MGSYFEVRVGARTPSAIDLVTRALDVIEALEAQLTVYHDDSEVARLNASAHLGPVAVEPGLFDLLTRAAAIYEATDGAYDVAAGALSLAWGFVRGPRRVPSADQLADARSRSGTSHLTFDPARHTVQSDREGVAINLGSIGKGYAVDRAADVLRDHWWPTCGLIHGGRSSLYALGGPPGSLDGRWPVALRNPVDPSHSLGIISLRDRGLGTSGNAFQSFEVDGRRYGHIIDPRTGCPPESGPLSVTVLAPSAAQADALSTAFTLLGVEPSMAYCAAHPEIAAIFALPGPSPRHVEVRAIGLELGEFEPSAAEGRPLRLAARDWSFEVGAIEAPDQETGTKWGQAPSP